MATAHVMPRILRRLSSDLHRTLQASCAPVFIARFRKMSEQNHESCGPPSCLDQEHDNRADTFERRGEGRLIVYFFFHSANNDSLRVADDTAGTCLGFLRAARSA